MERTFGWKSAWALLGLLAAQGAMADSGANLDVSYIGGVASEAEVEGDSYDSDLRMQGVRAAFYVPLVRYAFWQGSFDYSADDPYGTKIEISVGKLAVGGRLPLGEVGSLRAYAGYANTQIAEDGSRAQEGGALYGIAADVQVAERFSLEAYAEQAKPGDTTVQEAAVNGYWYFTPTIAAGAGYRYREFKADPADVSLNFSYVDIGLRISF